MQSTTLRDRLYVSLTSAEDSPANRKAVVDELLTRLQNAVHPTTAPVTVTSAQDTPDSAFLRLTKAQAQDLTGAPGIDSLKGLRDTALLALFLCTGIREMELAGLNVADLRQKLDGELALHVRQGKGAKARLVPYGEMDWCLVFVDRWLTVGSITEGAAFRSFWKVNKTIRDSRLSVRGIIDVVQCYPVMVDGDLRRVNVHDLRRTYARRL
ncbi:MAG: tyrosine-type recombinase/integrase [Aggregatilineales bacterium]